MIRSILSHVISYLFNFVLSSAASCARSTSARWRRRLVYLRQSSASTRRFTRHSCNRTTFFRKDDFHIKPVTFVVSSSLTARGPALISASCKSGQKCAREIREGGAGRAHNKYVGVFYHSPKLETVPSLGRARISLQPLVRNREWDKGRGRGGLEGD